MTQTITAMFDRYTDAAAAVAKLEAAGVAHSDISIVSNDPTKRDGHTADQHDAVGTGTGTGASLGTVLGGGAGLLAGLGLLAIPGLGPVVAAGWLASTLVGAGVGAAAGSAIGALTGAGISESDAHGYAEGLRRGGTLVTVRTEDGRASVVTDILDDDGTVDMAERESSWRKEGWSGAYKDGDDYAPGTTGALAPGAIGAAGSTTTGLGTAGLADTTGTRRRVGAYPAV